MPLNTHVNVKPERASLAMVNWVFLGDDETPSLLSLEDACVMPTLLNGNTQLMLLER